MIKRKQLFRGMMAASASLVLLASCTKDDNASGAPASGSYLRAKVDGAEFTSKFGGQEMAVVTKLDEVISISATNGASNEGMTLNLQGVTKTGTYTIDSESDSTLAYMKSDAFATDSCDGATGTVVVTAMDAHKIEGTFKFTGKNMDCDASKTVTDGTFRAVF